MNKTEAMKIDLPIWVVYDHPADHPEHIVVRRQFSLTDGNMRVDDEARLFQNLNDARNFCASMGLISLPRFPGDDPVIVETWL